MCFLAAAALVAASALTAAADVRSVLVRIGVRGAALRRLAERAAKAPGGMSASAAALEQSIARTAPYARTSFDWGRARVPRWLVCQCAHIMR